MGQRVQGEGMEVEACEGRGLRGTRCGGVWGARGRVCGHADLYNTHCMHWFRSSCILALVVGKYHLPPAHVGLVPVAASCYLQEMCTRQFSTGTRNRGSQVVRVD